ncbi:MAG: tyrosine--tRNA ligase, partial [Planctomycetota bacterium]
MAKLTDKEVTEQVEALCRGCEGLYTRDELEQRLKAAAEQDRQLRIKIGMDPTAPDIHLGHTVSLRKLRLFQDLGHRAVLIIGDYTARIGDPSGANKTRPMLSPQQIEDNARTYFDQAGLLLDTSPEKLEVRYNSEWLSKLTFAEVLQLAAQTTVARMMERDTFETRYKAGEPIGLHEFLYPLMQGYDSVCIHADVELGGTDQTFNNLVGRTLQAASDQQPQIVMVFPLLAGLDGVEKMSKSKGNYVGITEKPTDMFGKLMSIPDNLMDNYFTLLTDLPRERIDELLDGGRTHPREAKAALARTIVATYHGQEQAKAAEAEFQRVFSNRETPSEMPEVRLSDGSINAVELVMSAGFAKSTSEARRLIKQGAVSIDGEKLADINAAVSPKTDQVLKVGKRRFGRIVIQ